MKKLPVFLLIIFFIAQVFSINAQILNIEQERIKTDTTGWAGSGKLSFQYTNNDEELLTGGAYMHIQYKTKRSLYLSLTEYNLSKTTGSDFVNAGAQHFRYNYKINNWAVGEIFTQLQFNKVLKVKSRWLIGAGPRLKIVSSKTFNMFLATLYMFEHEELFDTILITNNHRLGSYIAFNLKFRDNLSLINTSYFQPLINDFSDFRILTQTDLKIGITKHFAFLLSYIYTFDKVPAIGVPKETHYFGNSIIYEF